LTISISYLPLSLHRIFTLSLLKYAPAMDLVTNLSDKFTILLSTPTPIPISISIRSLLLRHNNTYYRCMYYGQKSRSMDSTSGTGAYLVHCTPNGECPEGRSPTVKLRLLCAKATVLSVCVPSRTQHCAGRVPTGYIMQSYQTPYRTRIPYW
jgi:hypothetical protein